MGRETGYRSEEASSTKGRDESQYSHIEYGSTHGRWDQEHSSDFAITSVNVPDRLDTQEVRARAAADSERPSVHRFHRSDVIRAVRWLLAAAAAGALIWGTTRVVVPLRTAISPAGIEATLGAALDIPVSVADSKVEFLPAPRLVVTDVVAQSGFRLPAVALQFNWRDVLRGLQSSNWLLGEARVAPVEFTGQQALALLRSVRNAAGLPAGISTIRFESVAFPDLPLLPGRYEGVIRRGVGQREFGAVTLKRVDDGGNLELEIIPPAAANGSARFRLFATKWTATVGPAMVWNEAAAQGEFRADLLKIDSYNVAARFGSLSGSAELANDGRGWRLAGNVRGPDLNVEELIRHVAGLGDGEAAVSRVPLRGSAKFDLSVAGAGTAAQEALGRATASGAVTVQGATFVGLNLGLAATHGDISGAGGMTRFSDLDFDVLASKDGLAVRNLAGRAGNLRVYGGFSVDRTLHLSGALRPEVTSPRGVTGAQIRLGGTASSPAFH